MVAGVRHQISIRDNRQDSHLTEHVRGIRRRAMGSKRTARRRFLKEGAALAGLAVGVPSASGQTLGSVRAERPTDLTVARSLMAYGERARFVKTSRFVYEDAWDLHTDPNGKDAHTVLDQQLGIITPAP